MKRVYIVNWALVMLLALAMPSAQARTELEAASQYILAQDGVGMLQAENLRVRRAYSISIPEAGAAKRAIEEAYGGYAGVILIEYGVELVKPIERGIFASVGVLADGSMELCETPMELAARYTDLDILQGLEVEVISTE